MSADIQANHLLPDRPIVRVAVPGAKRVADSLAPQDSGKRAIVLVHRIALPNRENQILILERRQPSGIMLMLHEIERVARVYVRVRRAIRETLDVVVATHPDDAVHALRIAKPEARRV